MHIISREFLSSNPLQRWKVEVCIRVEIDAEFSGKRFVECVNPEDSNNFDRQPLEFVDVHPTISPDVVLQSVDRMVGKMNKVIGEGLVCSCNDSTHVRQV